MKTCFNESMKNSFRRGDIVVLFVVALGFYAVQSIAWPLFPGRDFLSYVTYFVQMFQPDDLGYPNTMLWRTPITPLFIGLLNRLGGGVLLEAVMAILYAMAILCTYMIGANFHRSAGLLGAVVLLVFPSYGNLFHQLSSDSIFACGFLCWVVFVLRTSNTVRLGSYAWHGVIVFLLVMIRPSSQIYISFAVLPLFVSTFTLRRRLYAAGIFLSTFFILITSYSFLNYIRYDTFAVTQGTAAFLPLKKVMVHYRLVNIENGEATLQMSQLMNEHLLDKEPYRSLGIDAKNAIENGGSRVLYDMKELSDEVFGSEDNYARLRKIAVEAILSHPFEYIKRSILDLYTIFFLHESAKEKINAYVKNVNIIDTNYLKNKMKERLNDKTLFEDVIPISHYELKMYEDEKSLKNIVNLLNKVESENISIPTREGNANLARILNSITRIFPGMAWFISIFAIYIIFCRSVTNHALIFINIISIVSVIIPSLLINQVWQYREPFDPIFIVSAAVAFVRNGLKNEVKCYV